MNCTVFYPARCKLASYDDDDDNDNNGVFYYKSEVGINQSVFPTSNLKAFQSICLEKNKDDNLKRGFKWQVCGLPKQLWQLITQLRALKKNTEWVNKSKIVFTAGFTNTLFIVQWNAP